ncbi:CBS domain-containing protein [Roseateles sp. SL47]|uniref:CBS domain-containing protein n=1 Tax=Roseateles sp. SL47 TaxID=2995138 RepID=UPI002271124C|nr:CBS domain-containing protein [Roseateles sp. SL47]WAC73327.1 CBS domain-containing protein [Roseateles sp. SL47]
MFTVYGTSGKIYTGPLEQVRDLAPVQAVARTRAVAPIARQEPDEPSSVAVQLGQGNGRGAGGGAGGGGAAPAGPKHPSQTYAAHEALAAYGGPTVRQPLSLVRQLMSRRLVSVRVGLSLRRAWGVLARAGVGQAPVLGPQGEVVGLITRADLLRGLSDDLSQAGEVTLRLDQPVDEVMWTPVPAATEDTPVREAAQLMLDLGLPGLPVVDDTGHALAFVSRSDLLRALTHEPPLDLWS